MTHFALIAILTAALIGLYGYICHLHDCNDALRCRNRSLRKRVLAAEQERELYIRLYLVTKRRTLLQYIKPLPGHVERANWRLN